MILTVPRATVPRTVGRDRPGWAGGSRPTPRGPCRRGGDPARSGVRQFRRCSPGGIRGDTYERVQQTLLEECWKPAFAGYLTPKYTGLQRDPVRELHIYSTDQAHQGRRTKGLTPKHPEASLHLGGEDSLVAGD